MTQTSCQGRGWQSVIFSMFFHYTQNQQNIEHHRHTPCDVDTERGRVGFSTPLRMGLRGGCFPYTMDFSAWFSKLPQETPRQDGGRQDRAQGF